jgi:hypothetical protein
VIDQATIRRWCAEPGAASPPLLISAQDMSTAFMNAYSQEWSMLMPHAGNQAYHGELGVLRPRALSERDVFSLRRHAFLLVSLLAMAR